MKRGMFWGPLIAAALVSAGPAQAQMKTVDPNQANDLAPVPSSEAAYGTNVTAPPVEPAAVSDAPADSTTAAPAGQAAAPAAAPVGTTREQAADASKNGTYAQDDVMSAAEGVFGKGAEGLGKLVEKILKDQGSPNAYIAGREVGGAIVLGVRYGSGTLFHKVEGQMPVYWTGPSLGFDLGGDATKVFVLVYNLYDSEELFRRFPAGEGRLYFIGGFAATYLRRGNVVLIPIRFGVGWRQGVNVGYMKFSHKSRWFPL